MYKYEEVSNKLRQQIIEGKYKPGDLLPDQNQIAEDFNTTRITIRKAIQSLIIEGVIYSKRGSGTFVRKDYESNLGNLESNIDKPLGTTSTHPNKKVTSKVLKLDARLPNVDEQAHLMISATEPVYVIERTRYIDDEAFSFEHTIMPTSILNLTNEILEGSIYDALSKSGLVISGSHRVVRAAKATDMDVSELGAESNDPVLIIRQTSYLEDGMPFEYSESHFPYGSGQVIADINLENKN